MQPYRKDTNEAAMLASVEALKRFDPDGAPIVMGAIKWTKRCAAPKVVSFRQGCMNSDRRMR